MSRSHSVYVVFDVVTTWCWAGGGYVDSCELTPLAGFTVKYEMVRWLKKNNRTPDDTEVYRMRDGGHGEPVEMEWML